jgi:hypothetical protein
MSFVNPIKYGKLTNSSSKTYTYTPEKTDSILAPFDGVVSNVDYSKCDGFIQISHLMNGKVFYSEICGVNKNIYVGGGMDVKKGDVIGNCGGKDITFEVKDGNKEKVSIAPFFIEKTELDKDNKNISDKDNKKEPEKELEKNIEKKNKKKEKEPTDDDDKKRWDFTGYNPSKPLPNLFTSLLLTPFAAIEAGLKPSKKKTNEDEEKLNEEIQKIKKLIK